MPGEIVAMEENDTSVGREDTAYTSIMLSFWPRAKLKGPKRSFVIVVVGRESFWNKQKMFAMEKNGTEYVICAKKQHIPL